MATIIDWPEALRPASVEWSLAIPQAGARSTFDGSLQTQPMGPPRWEFSIAVGPVTREDAVQWEVFLRRLRGRMNRARAWDWRREAPLGVATGTPTVRVASAGATLQTEGWTPSTAGILLAGSYFSVHGELKLLLQDASSDASGRATLAFEPPLRDTAPVGAALVLAKPTAVFVLTTERPAVVQDGARHRGPTLTFEEDVQAQ
jgi:hypothetical protein